MTTALHRYGLSILAIVLCMALLIVPFSLASTFVAYGVITSLFFITRQFPYYWIPLWIWVPLGLLIDSIHFHFLGPMPLAMIAMALSIRLTNRYIGHERFSHLYLHYAIGVTVFLLTVIAVHYSKGIVTDAWAMVGQLWGLMLAAFPALSYCHLRLLPE